MSTKKLYLKKIIKGLLYGSPILAAGVLIGCSYKKGQIKTLEKMYEDLLKELYKKTYHLGKLTEYIKKTRV